MVLFYFLLFSEGFGRTNRNVGYRYNLVLFQEITRFIKYYQIIGMRSVIVNVIGNIVAFAPFGFFLMILAKKKRGFLHIVLLSFQLSLTVEVIQLITKVGSYDVDDMMLNTLGGILGYIIYYMYRILFRRRTDCEISKKEGEL